jgi:hypothetical protein
MIENFISPFSLNLIGIEVKSTRKSAFWILAELFIREAKTGRDVERLKQNLFISRLGIVISSFNTCEAILS